MTTPAIDRLARVALLALLTPCAFGAGPREAAPENPVRGFLEARVRSDPDDVTAWNRLGALALAEFRQDGNFSALRRAEHAAAESLRAVPAAENLSALGLRARTAQAEHRFAAARDDADLLTRLAPDRADGWQILAEADLELGLVPAAEKAVASAARLEPDSIGAELCAARLATARGERAEAARRLDAARARAEALTPPPAEIVAWCRVRRGELAFAVGDLAAAEKEHRAALEASPGWFVAEDHLAETLAARGEFGESLLIYRELAERMSRPEIWQALGDVLVATGEKKEAAEWHERARAGYLASVDAGEQMYFHHLAAFFADVRPDGEAAVRWARRDLATRQSMGAWDALGWALYRAGQMKEAAEAQTRALAAPAAARDAHVLFHAALIFGAAGDAQRAGELWDAAMAVNPRGNGFHVHR